MNLDDIDIEQLVAYEGFDYRLSSGNRGLQLNVENCPECGDTRWKVYFNAETGLGNCFHCDHKFNKYKFVASVLRTGDKQKIYKYLQSIYNSIAYRPKTDYGRQTNDIGVGDWNLPDVTSFSGNLPEYLIQRNITPELAERFNLTLCQAGFYKYTNHKGKTRFVDFSNRIIIPVYDTEDNLVTFQGRDITGKSPKKYLFPNMLPGTGRFIYNANYAIKNKIKNVVINEGVFDVFGTTRALETDYTFRDYCAVGTFGKHFSINSTPIGTDQLADLFKLKESGVERFIIMWDGEPSAIQKARQTVLRLKSYGFDTTLAVLPDSLDPGEASVDAILNAIHNAKPVSKFDALKDRFNV